VRGRGSDSQSREKSARGSSGCASICPSDRRHTATFGDRDNGAERHLAMVCDTPRHAGLGLQNRRLQVRFLSHLPANPEFIGLQPYCEWPISRVLTAVDPIDTTRSDTADS
jgi:hypothetical protein